MRKEPDFKSSRMLAIYDALLRGKHLTKEALAERFGVTPRSIQRDMDDLRFFLAEQGLPQELLYDRREHAYRMANVITRGLTNSEILAVSKILLESRSMLREEMEPILDKLLECCVPEESRRAAADLLANEKFLYVEPHHGRKLLPGLWELGQAVREHRVLEIEYRKLKGEGTVTRILEPAGILFSEYYFYLVGFIRNIDRKEAFENPDDLFPTIYRLDRILSFRETGERFHPPYSGRFQEGEFRRRVQFMYGGRLETIRFRYTGPSIEAVLDRLPTAEILQEDDEGWTVRAEVFGKGIEMWLRSQGDYVRRLDPPGGEGAGQDAAASNGKE